MKNSKLIKTLKIIKQKDFDLLAAYVQSDYIRKNPYFQTSEDAIHLFSYLYKYYPAFDASESEDKKSVYSQATSRKPFSPTNYRHLLSNLLKIVEHFLVQRHFENNSFQLKKNLVEIYEKNNHPDFEKTTKQLLKQIEQHPQLSTNIHLDHYEILTIFYSYALQNNKLDLVPITKWQNTLDQLIVVEQLRMGVILKAREQALGENYNFSFYKPSNLTTLSNSLIETFKTAYQLTLSKEEKIYLQLKKLFKETFNKYHKKNARSIFAILMNYLVYKSREEKRYSKEYLDLYKFGLEKGIVTENDTMLYYEFINIAIIGSRLKDFDWTEKFIETYASKLPANEINNAKDLAYGSFYFYKGQYEKVIQLVEHLQPINPIYYYNPKFLFIASFYELFLLNPSYERLVFNKCTTLKRNIRRNKTLHPQKRLAFLNFVSFIENLVKYHDKTHPMSKERLIEVLASYSSLEGQNWVKEKMENLK